MGPSTELPNSGIEMTAMMILEEALSFEGEGAMAGLEKGRLGWGRRAVSLLWASEALLVEYERSARMCGVYLAGSPDSGRCL